MEEQSSLIIQTLPPILSSIGGFFVLLFFLVLWLVGLALGEPTRVLEQAKSICLECIGIG